MEGHGWAKMEMKKTAIEFKVSALAEDGTFTGLLSAYGNIDSGGDVVEKGAYRKTITENPTIPLCWHHDITQVIGVIGLKDADEGLMVEGKLNLDGAVPLASQAHSTMKFLRDNGLKMGLSIGYEVVKREIKDGVRYLRELRLREGSVVTTPMNDLCWVTGVKGADGQKDFDSELEMIQLWAKKYQMIDALDRALSDAFYGNTERDALLASIDSIIEQFSTRYKEWVRVPRLTELWGMKELPQLKAGRAISAANRAKLEAIVTNLQALLGEASTSEDQEAAYADEAAKSAEPDQDEIHSVIERLNKFSFKG